MVIDKDVATAVKKFLLNHAEVHGLPDTNVAAAVKNFLVNYGGVHGLPKPVRNVIRR
jgi:hypothetical protein